MKKKILREIFRPGDTLWTTTSMQEEDERERRGRILTILHFLSNCYQSEVRMTCQSCASATEC